MHTHLIYIYIENPGFLRRGKRKTDKIRFKLRLLPDLLRSECSAWVLRKHRELSPYTRADQSGRKHLPDLPNRSTQYSTLFRHTELPAGEALKLWQPERSKGIYPVPADGTRWIALRKQRLLSLRLAHRAHSGKRIFVCT